MTSTATGTTSSGRASSAGDRSTRPFPGPYAFAGSASVPFSTVIAEVTPEEFDRIQRNEIQLPKGWSLDKSLLFERPRAA